MYSNDDYAKQVVEGHLDENSGIYITDDGKRWMSVGSVDFGNNNFYEIMVLETKPSGLDEPFRHYQYPVFMACHDDGLDTLGQPLPEFFKYILEGDEHHLPEILIQLGHSLSKY
jgi:hypothetical protein